MSDLIFPQTSGLDITRTKTPEWKTITHRAVSGKETRTSLMSYPLWNFSLSYNLLRDDLTNELENLIGFYNNVKGSFDTFLYLDPYDNVVNNQNFAAGDGSKLSFQLTRNMGAFIEPIFNINGTPSIYINGIFQSSGYSISNGVITFLAPPSNGAVLSWTGSFYYRCRFVGDTMDFKQFTYNFWETKQVDFVSVK